MGNPRPLPAELGRRFSVQDALRAGASSGRLRRSDLETPFRGVRSTTVAADLSALDPFERQAAARRIRARRYVPRLRDDQFLSHESAVALYGGPLPLVIDRTGPVDGMELPVHVATLGRGTLVRANGVTAHRANPLNTRIANRDGIRLASTATAWAQLGAWSVLDLVALGDFFCRVWRSGPGRRDVGRRPLATVDELRAAISAGRRTGIARLREAVELIREDSWSPRESMIRFHLIAAGLPEPSLNHDVYDSSGRFLGCVDLAYPEQKIAIEYQSVLHHSRYAADVERIAALRAAGWVVIEITSDLFTRSDVMIDRVRRALRA